MKKCICIIIFFIITANIFAQHHNKDIWGLGIHGRNDWAYDEKVYSFGGPGISLKAPKVPVFWNMDLGLRKNNWLNVNVSGDYYIIDKTFVEEINLGWFLGVGGYFNFINSGARDDRWSRVGFGLRVPIGISWIFRERLEVFGYCSFSPGIDFWTNSRSGIYFPAGSIISEIGVRYWFK